MDYRESEQFQFARNYQPLLESELTAFFLRDRHGKFHSNATSSHPPVGPVERVEMKVSQALENGCPCVVKSGIENLPGAKDKISLSMLIYPAMFKSKLDSIVFEATDSFEQLKSKQFMLDEMTPYPTTYDYYVVKKVKSPVVVPDLMNLLQAKSEEASVFYARSDVREKLLLQTQQVLRTLRRENSSLELERKALVGIMTPYKPFLAEWLAADLVLTRKHPELSTLTTMIASSYLTRNVNLVPEIVKLLLQENGLMASFSTSNVPDLSLEQLEIIEALFEEKRPLDQALEVALHI